MRKGACSQEQGPDDSTSALLQRDQEEGGGAGLSQRVGKAFAFNSPSIISLMVSVDVKHHVYFASVVPQQSPFGQCFCDSVPHGCSNSS